MIIDYTALSKDRNILYFLSFFLSNNYNKFQLKVYKIDLYNLYHFKLFREITTILYNNYLTLSSSVCNTLPCDQNNKKSNYFSLLIIFGYINNTDSFKDKFIDISPFLNNTGNDNIINILQENAIINNNIFGYEFCKEIKLVSIPDDLIFYNNKSYNKSLQGQNETNKLTKLNNGNILFYEHELYLNESNIKNYYTILQYQLIAHESYIENNYNELNYFNAEGEDDNFDFENNRKIFYGKLSEVKLQLYENCDQKYYINKENNKKVCLNNEKNCPAKYPFLNIETNECKQDFTYEDIINSNIIIDINQNNITSFNEIKKTIIDNYNGLDNIIIKSENNNIYQITNSLNENNIKNNDNINNYNISIIELGQCENLLKKKNNIDENIPLTLFKLEINDNINNSSKKNIYYEVINPTTKQKLDLSICDKEKIIINIPTALSDYTLELYKNMSDLGYDIFDKNNIFYNDICTIFTSNYTTDVILSDRRKDYYDENNEIYIARKDANMIIMI